MPAKEEGLKLLVACERCSLIPEIGKLHRYEFTPLNLYYSTPTLHFNVSEVRLFVEPKNIQYFEYPYDPMFLKLLNAHEFVPGHEDHIPWPLPQPLLAGNVEVQDLFGRTELLTILLDGHHSGLRCVKEQAPIPVQWVPTEKMNALAAFSTEELLQREVIVLEA